MLHENNAVSSGNNYRNKLTVEVFVCFDYAVGTFNGNAILLQRTLESPVSPQDTISTGKNVWCLFVAPDGSIGVSCDTDLSGTTDKKSVVTTAPNVIKVSGDSQIAQTPEQEEEDIRYASTANWYHIAVTFDSSQSNTAITANNHMKTDNTTVSIHVNCNKLIESVISIPEVSIEALEHNLLFVGPDLGVGWRLTELR